MAICYIEQTEVYNSSSQNDRLNILNAITSTSLLEDLNYIRSVIFRIYGQDTNNLSNTWYKVPFYNLTYLYNLYNKLLSDFSVEHYTSAESSTRADQHKNTNVNGYLNVTGYANIAGALTSGSQTVNGNEDITGYIHAVGNISTDASLFVAYDTNLGRDLLVNRNLTVKKNTLLGDFTSSTETRLHTRTTYLNSPDTIHEVLDSTTFYGFSDIFNIPLRNLYFLKNIIRIGSSLSGGFYNYYFEDGTANALVKIEAQNAVDASQNYITKDLSLYKDKRNYYIVSLNANSYKREKLATSLNTSIFPSPGDTYTETPINNIVTHDGNIINFIYSSPQNSSFIFEEKSLSVFDSSTNTTNTFSILKNYFYYNSTENNLSSSTYSASVINYIPTKYATYSNIFYKIGLVDNSNKFNNFLVIKLDSINLLNTLYTSSNAYFQGSVGLPLITL